MALRTLKTGFSLLESMHWAAQNPEQAVDHLPKADPQLVQARSLAGFEAIPATSLPRAGKTSNALHLAVKPPDAPWPG